MNVLLGWVRKKSIKVKIFLGIVIAAFALVGLKLTIRDHNYFFIASEAVHLSGILVLFYKIVTQKTCSGMYLYNFALLALIDWLISRFVIFFVCDEIYLILMDGCFWCF